MQNLDSYLKFEVFKYLVEDNDLRSVSATNKSIRSAVIQYVTENERKAFNVQQLKLKEAVKFYDPKYVGKLEYLQKFLKISINDLANLKLSKLKEIKKDLDNTIHDYKVCISSVEYDYAIRKLGKNHLATIQNTLIDSENLPINADTYYVKLQIVPCNGDEAINQELPRWYPLPLFKGVKENDSIYLLYKSNLLRFKCMQIGLNQSKESLFNPKALKNFENALDCTDHKNTEYSIKVNVLSNEIYLCSDSKQ
ncbi:MAG: hypothetical protein K0S74_111 [Chlamydiales bacterium]|jgi:hypothetical protein|nr:hypothetical protein [Chlamydiales bacterium]